MDQSPAHAEYITAYKESKSDREAGEKVGVLASSYRVWRHRFGYPAFQEQPLAFRGNQISPDEHARRTEAWSTSIDLGEAAEKLGMKKDTLWRWALKEGLSSPLKHRTLGPQGELSKDARYSRAYHEAKSDQQAAEFLGVNQKAFMRWRRRHNLPATSIARRKWIYEQKKAAQTELDRQLRESHGRS